MPTVSVTGATGNIGRELIHLLSLDPRVGEIRIGTRYPDGDAARLLVAIDPAVVRPVKLTDDPDDLAEVFGDGVDRVCLITPLCDDMVGWQKTVLTAARNVSRIVKPMARSQPFVPMHSRRCFAADLAASRNSPSTTLPILAVNRTAQLGRLPRGPECHRSTARTRKKVREGKPMKVTDILSKTFQICWVTNDLDRATEHFKAKFDVERFLVMDEVPFTEVTYRGEVVDKGKVRGAWANAGDINLELVEPQGGFTLDLYGPKVQGSDFKMAFHHIGVRFDADLAGYEAAVQAMKDKGYETSVESGIEGISRFTYFDTEDELGHQLEIIYLNPDGVAFMDKVKRGDF